MDVGEGYRQLEFSELLLQGDEYRNFDGTWLETCHAGLHVGDTPTANTYRRKVVQKHVVDVGEGYRRLGPDEIIQPGDEFNTRYDNKWKETTRDSSRVSNMSDHYTYRRKIEPDARGGMSAGDVIVPFSFFQQPLFAKSYHKLVSTMQRVGDRHRQVTDKQKQTDQSRGVMDLLIGIGLGAAIVGAAWFSSL